MNGMNARIEIEMTLKDLMYQANNDSTEDWHYNRSNEKKKIKILKKPDRNNMSIEFENIVQSKHYTHTHTQRDPSLGPRVKQHNTITRFCLNFKKMVLMINNEYQRRGELNCFGILRS
ncbi:hypothetical protein NH340_JMT00281 [Sarcoptes scabiei]|nr:hypothetical protein NH340_JMT00281 [Sarcoptes scabiei]